MSSNGLIIKALDEYIVTTGKAYLTAVEAAAYLDKKGILKDSTTRPGKPLRELLRAGKIPHAYRDGVHWKIPHSGRSTRATQAPVIRKAGPPPPDEIAEKGLHKLEPIAALVAELLEGKYATRPRYTLEHSPEWLKTIPEKSALVSYWPLIKKVYAELVDGRYDLDERIKLVNRSGSQQFDIWFHAPYSFALEFDESQHFSQFRGKTLKHYSHFKHNLVLEEYLVYNETVKAPGSSGFQKLKSWDPLFPEMYPGDKQDNRIRQRAFRDFLKDIMPVAAGKNPTVRIPFHVVGDKIKDFGKRDLDIVREYLSGKRLLHDLKLN